MTALLYLLVLGFPLAMFLSWRYDLTEHGVVRTAASTGEGMDPGVMRLRAADYLILLVFLGILGFIAYRSLVIARQTAEIEKAKPIAACSRGQSQSKKRVVQQLFHTGAIDS